MQNHCTNVSHSIRKYVFCNFLTNYFFQIIYYQSSLCLLFFSVFRQVKLLINLKNLSYIKKNYSISNLLFNSIKIKFHELIILSNFKEFSFYLFQFISNRVVLSYTLIDFFSIYRYFCIFYNTKKKFSNAFFSKLPFFNWPGVNLRIGWADFQKLMCVIFIKVYYRAIHHKIIKILI